MAQDQDKAQRLASALRANLARRKAQGRARKAAEGAGQEGAPAPDTAAPPGLSTPEQE